MQVISRKKLLAFSTLHPDTKEALDAWFAEAKRAKWKSPSDIQAQYRSASSPRDNRMVFNIKGNHYRLIVRINYDSGAVFVRFIGTHAEYDRIDANEI
jgi:mRNA interferase HigB